MSEQSEDDNHKETALSLDEVLWQAIVVSLREIRVNRRISIRTLCQKIMISSAHLSRVEKGGTIPSVILVFRWCRALNVDFLNLYQSALNMNGDVRFIDHSRDFAEKITESEL